MQALCVVASIISPMLELYSLQSLVQTCTKFHKAFREFNISKIIFTFGVTRIPSDARNISVRMIDCFDIPESVRNVELIVQTDKEIPELCKINMDTLAISILDKRNGYTPVDGTLTTFKCLRYLPKKINNLFFSNVNTKDFRVIPKLPRKIHSLHLVNLSNVSHQDFLCTHEHHLPLEVDKLTYESSGSNNSELQITFPTTIKELSLHAEIDKLYQMQFPPSLVSLYLQLVQGPVVFPKGLRVLAVDTCSYDLAIPNATQALLIKDLITPSHISNLPQGLGVLVIQGTPAIMCSSLPRQLRCLLLAMRMSEDLLEIDKLPETLQSFIISGTANIPTMANLPRGLIRFGAVGVKLAKHSLDLLNFPPNLQELRFVLTDAPNITLDMQNLPKSLQHLTIVVECDVLRTGVGIFIINLSKSPRLLRHLKLCGVKVDQDFFELPSSVETVISMRNVYHNPCRISRRICYAPDSRLHDLVLHAENIKLTFLTFPPNLYKLVLIGSFTENFCGTYPQDVSCTQPRIYLAECSSYKLLKSSTDDFLSYYYELPLSLRLVDIEKSDKLYNGLYVPNTMYMVRRAQCKPCYSTYHNQEKDTHSMEELITCIHRWLEFTNTTIDHYFKRSFHVEHFFSRARETNNIKCHHNFPDYVHMHSISKY